MTPVQKKKFAMLVSGLNDLIADVRKSYPKANYYIEDSNNFNLLSDESHDENGKSRQDRILVFQTLHHAGGGGWEQIMQEFCPEQIPKESDRCELHTKAPIGYIAWHEWAEKMIKTHTQRQCNGCGLYKIWEPG